MRDLIIFATGLGGPYQMGVIYCVVLKMSQKVTVNFCHSHRVVSGFSQINQSINQSIFMPVSLACTQPVPINAFETKIFTQT